MGTLDKVKGLVENPPKEYRSAPFWGWNDRLQKENLGEQIEGFKKAGMGGFFIHSREGLETEYLSTEWMEDVKFCVDKAEKMIWSCGYMMRINGRRGLREVWSAR
jgi:hypothetical protein